MQLILSDSYYTVCQVSSFTELNLQNLSLPYFFSATTNELSLVCKTCEVPLETIARKDNFRMFKIDAVLDFSLVGIIAKISAILAHQSISIFVVSTYDTDYILVDAAHLTLACKSLTKEGYTIVVQPLFSEGS